ncbi:MAG: cellulose biosynthesis protein BcsS [Pseudomonadota bacterium]
MRSLQRLAWIGACLTAPALCTAQAASSSPDLLIAGSQGSSDTHYSYVGTLVPMWGGTLGQGWFRKTVASWLTYRFDTVQAGQNVTVRAQAPGIEGGLGYAWNAPGRAADVSLSIGARHTRLDPDVSTAGTRGTELTLTPQGFIRQDLNRWLDADVLASYSFGTEGRFARGRLGTRVVPNWRIGVEGVQVAGPDYRSLQRGVFASTSLSNGMSLDLNAGQARARDGKTAAYVGVALSKTY